MRISLKWGCTHQKSSYQDPSPSLSLIDKSCKEWSEEITADEEKAIDRYVSPPFVCEILKESEREAKSVFTR